MEQQVLLVGPQLHIRLEGRSFDLPQGDLDVGALSTDAQVRQAVSNHLGVPLAKIQTFAIDRNAATGSMTLRPEAVFGAYVPVGELFYEFRIGPFWFCAKEK